MRFRSGIVRGRGGVVYRSAIVALLVAHVALVTLQIVTTFPVVDELAHVPSGVAHWQEHDFAYYRVNPPLGRLVATAPMMLPWYDSVYKSVDYQDDTGARRPEFSAGHRVFSKLGMGIADEFTLPRFGGLAFSLFGAILLGSWVREEAGELAGVVSVGLWALSPTMIANAAVVLPDMAGCSMGVLACYAVYRWAGAPSLGRASVAGVCVALSMLSKSTWVLGLVVFPACFLIARSLAGRRRLASRAAPGGSGDAEGEAIPSQTTSIGTSETAFRRWMGLVLQVAACLLVAIVLVNGGYFFTGWMEPLDSFEFRSRMLSGMEGLEAPPGNRFAGTFLGSFPSLLPRDYLLGIDYLKWEVEEQKLSFLAGEIRLGGWWYYYLVAVAIKTPLGTILLASIGSVLLIRDHARSLLLFLAVPAMVLFASISITGGFNHHHRYVLSIYPVIFAAAGCAFGRGAPGGRGWWFLTGASLVVAAIASLSAVGYPHSFFNRLAGGPYNGYRWLTFSNVEWGHDLKKVESWITRHSGSRDIAAKFGYNVSVRNHFADGVIDFDRLSLLLTTDRWRNVVNERGIYVVVHANRLSDLPSCSISRAVDGREPSEFISPAYRVYLFQGESDLRILDRAHGRGNGR